MASAPNLYQKTFTITFISDDPEKLKSDVFSDLAYDADEGEITEVAKRTPILPMNEQEVDAMLPDAAVYPADWESKYPEWVRSNESLSREFFGTSPQQDLDDMAPAKSQSSSPGPG